MKDRIWLCFTLCSLLIVTSCKMQKRNVRNLYYPGIGCVNVTDRLPDTVKIHRVDTVYFLIISTIKGESILYTYVDAKKVLVQNFREGTDKHKKSYVHIDPITGFKEKIREEYFIPIENK